MGLNNWSCLFLLLFILPASASISDGIFDDRASTGRNLLQTKKPCPVNFEFKNYSIITSQCKGPQYPANLCCAAFKEFACPYAEEINDLSSDCASTMFSYINLYGKYPPGLFASECREGKEGLICPASSPSESLTYNGSQIITYSLALLLFIMGLLLLV
ncbi:hypothetical protein NMG60_11002013 [Bertholletia excelsa]